MCRIQKRHEKGCNWEGMVTPNIRKRLNHIVEQSRQCIVLFAGNGLYDVKDE